MDPILSLSAVAIPSLGNLALTGEVGRGATSMDPQSDEAAAQAEFLNAFAPGVDLDGEEELDSNR